MSRKGFPFRVRRCQKCKRMSVGTNLDGEDLCAYHYQEWEAQKNKAEMLALCQEIIGIVGYDRYWKMLDTKFPGSPNTLIDDDERLAWARKTIYELKQVADVRSNDLGSK